MVAGDDHLEVDSEWAEFDFGGDASAFSNGASLFDPKKGKKKKKKKDKGSESGSSDGMKKKKKKRRDSDDDLKDFNSALFERAIADVLGEDDAASGVAEDHAFINAFDDGQSEGHASFKANFQTSIPEHAPRKPVDDVGYDSDTGGFVVENNRKGERMKTFATRQRSVTDSEDEISYKSGRSAKSGRSSKSSAKSNADTHRVSNHGGERSVDMTPADIQELQTSESNRHLDFSSYELEVQDDEFGDSATINSELTGLTGVFSRMRTNVDVEDDESESGTEDAEVLQYPKYDPAYSKFMMMQNKPKKAKPKQKVKFGSITIRELERILGDNPSCKSGPPVSVGWKVASVKMHHTPDAHYKSRNREPLPSTEFVMSRDYRHAMLLDLGYSQREIATAVRAVIRDKNRRRTTVNNLGASSVVEEKMETARNGLKRILFLKKSNA